MAAHLLSLFAQTGNLRFVIFAHSFGTYLVIEALRKLVAMGVDLPLTTVVLAGSVLPNDVDVSFLTQRRIRLVNDCADGDYVLWLSEAIIPDLGMAGKTGIYGFESEFLVNRFKLGGHSSYFDGDDYMNTHWLPLLADASVHRFDLRESSSVRQDFLERIVAVIASFKRRHFET